MKSHEQGLMAVIEEDMEILKTDIKELLKDRKKREFEDLKSGIICPNCNHICNSVKDTRIRNGFRMRYKVCTNCGRKWSTVEILH